MKWLNRWFAKKCKEAWESAQEDRNMGLAIPTTKLASSSDHDWGDGLNINVHTANGGKIVTFRRYDRKTDRNNHNVYIIPDDHDFERELGKLITLEAMRG